MSTYYSNTTDTFVQKDLSLFGSSRLGLLEVYNNATSTGTVLTRGHKQYELSNHLGNVLATLSDTKTPQDPDADGDVDYHMPNLLSAQDYYAFGAIMPGRTYSSNAYRYGFGSYEKDDEVSGSGNHITFGDYGYDPRTNRRWTVDKFTKKYPSYSPYVFAGDNPIFYQDKDGNDKIWYMNVILKDGTTIPVATKRIVNNQCSLHYSQTAGADGTGGDRFYTTDLKQTVTLDLQDGKITVSPVEDDYSSQKSFGAGLLMKGGAILEGGGLEGKERGKQEGGLTLTSEFAALADGPKTDATKGSSGSVNIDLIMAAFGAKGKSLELPDLKEPLGRAEALNTVKELMSETKELFEKYKENGEKSFENAEMHCENECGTTTTLKKVDSVQAADGYRHNFVPKKK